MTARAHALAVAASLLLLPLPALAQEPPPDKPPPDPPPDSAQPVPPPQQEGAPEGQQAAPQPGEGPGGPQGPEAQPQAQGPPPLQISGYLAPGFGFKVRPNAVDRDKYEYGFDGGAGLIFDANPIQYIRALLHITLSSRALSTVLTNASPVDNNGDGIVEGYTFSKQENVPGIGFEEADISFQPLEWFTLKGGIMRIPFTSAQQSPVTATMFPTRPEPNDVFMTGSDYGALVQAELADGRSVSSFGVFNGTSLGMVLRTERFEQHGPVLAFRTDLNPFGRFAAGETDPVHKNFRLGFGFGAMYRPSVIYDKGSGYEVTKADDVRLSGSIRMAYSGLSLGVEYLRRQQTDGLSSRPQVADGAYAQAGWYVHPVTAFAFEPIARLGFTILNELVEPQIVEWLDLGVSLYPFAGNDRPDVLKIWLEYNGERRITEDEIAHGALLSAQLQF